MPASKNIRGNEKVKKEVIRNIIDQACSNKDMGLCALADYLGVGHATIYRWYNGQEPSLDNFMDLLKIAGVKDVSTIYRA